MFEPKAKYISLAVMESFRFLKKRVGLKLAAFEDRDSFQNMRKNPSARTLEESVSNTARRCPTFALNGRERLETTKLIIGEERVGKDVGENGYK